jgi:hypothetical protein
MFLYRVTLYAILASFSIHAMEVMEVNDVKQLSTRQLLFQTFHQYDLAYFNELLSRNVELNPTTNRKFALLNRAVNAYCLFNVNDQERKNILYMVTELLQRSALPNNPCCKTIVEAIQSKNSTFSRYDLMVVFMNHSTNNAPLLSTIFKSREFNKTIKALQKRLRLMISSKHGTRFFQQKLNLSLQSCLKRILRKRTRYLTCADKRLLRL